MNQPGARPRGLCGLALEPKQFLSPMPRVIGLGTLLKFGLLGKVCWGKNGSCGVFE